jgi:protein-S-isoprenylcysteine O-methyltransferase Ste14
MGAGTARSERVIRFPRKPLRGLLKVLSVIAVVVLAVIFSSPRMPWLCFGLAVVVAGEGARVWAAGHLARNERLATGGPYAYTRNPMYLGRMLLIIGFSALVWGPAGIGLLVIGLAYFFLFYMPRKEMKEPERLEEIFGEEYRDYRRSVPALLPRFTPYAKASGRWSWEAFLGNREQLMMLFVTACALSVLAKWWLSTPK